MRFLEGLVFTGAVRSCQAWATKAGVSADPKAIANFEICASACRQMQAADRELFDALPAILGGAMHERW